MCGGVTEPSATPISEECALLVGRRVGLRSCSTVGVGEASPGEDAYQDAGGLRHELGRAESKVRSENRCTGRRPRAAEKGDWGNPKNLKLNASVVGFGHENGHEDMTSLRPCSRRYERCGGRVGGNRGQSGRRDGQSLILIEHALQKWECGGGGGSDEVKYEKKVGKNGVLRCRKIESEQKI